MTKLPDFYIMEQKAILAEQRAFFKRIEKAKKLLQDRQKPIILRPRKAG